MKKLITFTGASILAIIATTNANAAGYTCEELIEYTSCNTGYYLNDGDCIEGSTCGAGNYLKACPEGWTLYTGFCGSTGISPSSISEMSGYTYEECAEASEEETYYLSSACGIELSWDEETLDYDIQEAGDVICTPCVAGTYQPTAGKYSCITCPAGSECATSGLTTATLCESGEYSNAGATACSTCPTHQYTNASGQSVTVSATSLAGAASAAACYIGPDTYFTDLTGTYHFTSNCEYNPFPTSITSQADCDQLNQLESVNKTWFFESIEEGDEQCVLVNTDGGYDVETSLMTQEQCESFGEEATWDNGVCSCGTGDDGEGIIYFDENGFSCNVV